MSCSTTTTARVFAGYPGDELTNDQPAPPELIARAEQALSGALVQGRPRLPA